MAGNVDTADQTSFETATLSQEEENLLTNFYNRGLQDVRSERREVLTGMFREYQDAIKVAAEGAREQFNSRFDGQQPASGRFGVSTIHSGYFGWDAWSNLSLAADTNIAAWIDGGAPDNLEGAGGRENPATVGNSAFHIILGVGDYTDDSSLTRVRWRLNDQPRAAVNTELQFKNSDMNVAFLDSPVVLGEDDDIFAEIYSDTAAADVAPYLIGLSFVEHKEARRLDPAELVGSERVVYQ